MKSSIWFDVLKTLQKKQPDMGQGGRTFALGAFLRAALQCLMPPRYSCKEIPQLLTK